MTQFPLSDQMNVDADLAYLNHAAIGPTPKKTLEILQEIYSNQSRAGGAATNFEEFIELWDKVRGNIARLVRCDKEGVAITSNTASALHIVADGLHHYYKEGDNIVITDSEFTTNSYVWQKVANRYKMNLHSVPVRDNQLLFEDWENLIDNRTSLVSLSHVQFSNGFRSDLEQISKLAHDHGAYVVSDTIQSLGVVPFDFEKSGVDFIASGGYKWLLGPYSIGFFCTKPEHIDVLDTILVGWFSSKEYLKMSHNMYEPWGDARRFQQSPIINMRALNASVETILSWDVSKTFSHVKSLHDHLIKEIADLDFTVSTCLMSENRSGILKIETTGDAKEIVEFLKENQIIVAYRDRGIRIAPHAYNTKEDIDKLVNGLRLWIKRSN
ncbi:MAG: aminotransferase class V-fold PLP-dependent enzyme [Candidatus Kariarchaeaceae archaeon]|jgi:selenocysteine lyase/cysteine desulfurase